MSMEKNTATVQLTVKGKVQGVFYRVSAKKAADRLGITGWVKNMATGEVEIVASGPQEALDGFVRWCKEGPPGARVTEVVVLPCEPKSFPGFTIER